MAMNRLYVANLGEGMDGDWIQRTFSQFSPIEKIFVMQDRKSKTGRLSAFVTLTDQAACQRAIDALHNSPCLDGNQYGLVVRYSEPPGAKGPVMTQQQPQQQYGQYNNWQQGGYGGGKGYGHGGYQSQGGWNQSRGGHHNSHHSGYGGFQPHSQGSHQPQQQQLQPQQLQQQPQQQAAAPSATGNVIYSGGKAWYEASDPATRKTYYYTSAGETTWDRPVEDGAGKKKGVYGKGARPY